MRNNQVQSTKDFVEHGQAFAVNQFHPSLGRMGLWLAQWDRAIVAQLLCSRDLHVQYWS